MGEPQTATPQELKEPFCRDVDAFSFEFAEKKDERPHEQCDTIPGNACCIAYDSSTCSPSGWKLVLPQGEMRFRFFSANYKFRNDMDTVGVRQGCTFTGYSGSNYNGNAGVITAEQWDKWIVFADSPELSHMDEDIESVRCYCTD